MQTKLKNDISEMVVKIFIRVVLLVVYCNAQFHQNSYHIIHDKIEITEYNHTAVIKPEINLLYVNNTKTQAFNASAYFTPGVKKNILLNAALYKFVSKKYRPFPINVTLDLCDEYKKGVFGIDEAVKLSNFKGCPCPVGEYWLHETVLEEERFPPHIPFGKYKLEMNVHIDDNILLGRGYWYGSIVSKSKWEEENAQ